MVLQGLRLWGHGIPDSSGELLRHEVRTVAAHSGREISAVPDATPGIDKLLELKQVGRNLSIFRRVETHLV